ncbi:MAG TPA: alpha/beta hydrolase [Mycobacteriales bacterium]|nr:alpha/beta hydrolase [Mycobacteriales bacterium]
MTPDTRDLRDAARLGGDALAAVTGAIRDTHLAIARRAFTLSGPPARPAQMLHDGISRGVYGAVRTGMSTVATVGGTVVAHRASRAARRRTPYLPLADRPHADVAVGALNGAWGDRLARTGNRLSLSMSVRCEGRDVAVTPDALRGAFPEATGDVAVWLHGLCETETAWRLGATKHYGDPSSTHGSRLRLECGLTSVYLRYNTGRHISDNGAEFAALLTDLVEHWPVPVERLTLVGHSMGGLVIRSACHAAAENGGRAPWLPLTKRIVYLGAPHLGAPLELGAVAAAAALRKLPETRPLGDALASRSVGIKDLRYGDIRALDWSEIADPDAQRPEPAECQALLETAEHYYVGATIARDRDGLAARAFGDALVLWSSASGSGKRRRLGLAVDHGRHLGGLHHFDLLNHPRVYAVLREWLAR